MRAPFVSNGAYRCCLTVYRLAFGQPRQDDLLDYLQTLVGPGMDAVGLADLQIRLEPGILDDPAR